MFEFTRRSHVGAVPLTSEAPRTGQWSLSFILDRLRHGVKTIAAVVLLAMIAGVVMLMVVAPVYTARIQILVDPGNLRIVDNDINPRAPLADSGVSITESQVRVITSDNVFSRVITALDLTNDPEFAARKPGALSEGLNRVLGRHSTAPDPALQALELLRQKVTARRAERTFVIDVVVKAGEPQKAAQIANAVADAYIAEAADARADIARRTSDVLSARLTALRDAVSDAEDRVVKFRESHNIVASNGRLLTDQQLADLNAQHVAASIRAEEARSRYEQATQAADDASLPEVLQSPEMQNLRQQLSLLTRGAAELSARLGPRHPSVTDQQASIGDLRRTIQRERARIVGAAKIEMERARASEEAIRRSLDRVKVENAGHERAFVGLRELERELDARRNVYEAFLRRAREASEQERLDTTNVRVISPAAPPRSPAAHNSPKIILGLAAIVGLLAGAALVLLRAGLSGAAGRVPSSAADTLVDVVSDGRPKSAPRFAKP
jgi:succinoglycan biosynthesis transport protein ExoP